MPIQLLETITYAALVIFVYMTTWFAVALAIKRNDVTDIAWGFGFVTVSIAMLLKTQNYTFTSILVTILVLVWGVRLGSHIATRNIKKPEDYRYRAWRDSWGKLFVLRSYVQIFMLQGFLMLVIATPLAIIYTYSTDGILPVIIAGTSLWIFGFLFESIGDKQLKDFIRNPKNKGHVMTKGLWQYSRHPNYFGEVTQWWAIGIVALPFAYGWLGLVGSATITFLIVKVSGVPMLENKYSGNTEYQRYKQHTSMLIPWFRKA